MEEDALSKEVASAVLVRGLSSADNLNKMERGVSRQSLQRRLSVKSDFGF